MKRMTQGAALALCFLAPPGPALAAEPPAFPDFTFKFGKPPAPGTTPRITVRIEPRALQPAGPAPVAPATAAPRAASLGWFWDSVPPGIDTDSGIRLAAAWARLRQDAGGPTVPAPRLQSLQAIAQAHGADILRATIGTRVSPALVLAVIAVESGGRVRAVSGKGAQGLMQLMPDTAARFGVSDSLSPAENIRGGVAYLDWLMGEFGSDAMLALAGYNAGENAVRKHAGVPPYAETRDYVPKVLAAFDVARGLCKSRPELITDACAFDIAGN